MRVSLTTLLTVLAAQLAYAASGDVPGSQDPELLGQRFEGAVIYNYKQSPLDKLWSKK